MFLRKALLITLSIFFSLLVSEISLRIKHSIVLDYDIEMWRYAKLLKIKDFNPKINHTHKKNSKAILQGVEIKINNFGQRDIDYTNNTLKNYKKSFLFLGSSVTLGWGVDNNKTYVQLLNENAKKNEKNWIFINGGIGNYNTERYTNNYFENWSNLNFTDIIVNFFANDTELINQKETNLFVRNTHLGVAIWKIFHFIKNSSKQESLQEYYVNKYKDDFEGYKITKEELLNLKDFCKKRNITLHIILIPDINYTNSFPYPLSFIGEKISKFSNENKIKYYDLYNSVSNVENNKLRNKYKDLHPNDLGHLLFSRAIYRYLAE